MERSEAKPKNLIQKSSFTSFRTSLRFAQDDNTAGQLFKTLFRSRPQYSVRRQINVESLPAVTPVAADHKVAGTAGAGSVTAGDVADAGKDGSRFVGVMDQRPDHGIQIIRQTVGDSLP